MRGIVVATAALILIPSVPAWAESPTPRDRVVASAWVGSGYPLPDQPNYSTVSFRLYVDGRLLTPGNVDAHGVMTYRVAELRPREGRRLLERFARATVDVDFGFVPVADVGYTFTRVDIDGRPTYRSINALSMDTGLTTAQRRARTHLAKVIEAMSDHPGNAYVPMAFEARRLPVDGPGVQIEWMGPRLPRTDCAAVEAGTYADFPREFQQGNAYTSDGAAFTLWLRPLLPGQEACRRL
ncbi:MAG: hypothetical protein ACKOMX_09580 [Actinomycetota bacterium]